MLKTSMVSEIPTLRGWRAEVGMLAPLPGMYREWDIVAPKGIKFSKAILGLPQNTPEDLKNMAKDIENEAKKLNVTFRCDVICLGCTSGSFIGGPNYDKEIIQKIESASGSPGLTTTTCVLGIFEDMNIKKMALVGPYKDNVLDAEVDFFRANGVETFYVRGLGLVQNSDYWEYHMDPYRCYPLVKDAAKAAPDADCIFVTCMMSSILGIADILEDEIGKPIISSPSATLYGILKKLRIPDPVLHYGGALKQPRC